MHKHYYYSNKLPLTRSRNLSTINRQGKQEMSGQHRAEKSEEEDGREKNYEKAIFR